MSPEPLKTALVTGAARRIGRAIALDLARHGWAVAVHWNRSEQEAREVVGLIKQGGGRAALIRADLAREAETETLVPRAAAASLLGQARDQTITSFVIRQHTHVVSCPTFRVPALTCLVAYVPAGAPLTMMALL